ncbi:MAG: ABC-2 family transporter protein [bacterium]|nr:ABC-2 family transporter protein [bacterium]
MKRYIRIFKVLFRTSLIREMAFRSNFVVGTAVTLSWIAVYFILLEVIFLHTDFIAGWSRRDAIMLYGVWSMMDDLISWFVAGGLKNLPLVVEDGTLDRLLTKPIDSQFIISFDRFEFNRAPLLLVDIGIILYAYSLHSISLRPIMFLAPLLVINGAMIGYSILLLFESLAFWFVRVSNIWALYHGIADLARYPVDIFGRVIKAVSFTVLPFAVMMMVPAQAFLGTLSFGMVGYSILVSSFFLLISRKFYQFAVRRYSSVA